MEIITSVHNGRISQIRELQKTKGRREQGLFLVEGHKMVREAMDAGLCKCVVMLSSQTETYTAILDAAAEKGLEILCVSEPVFGSLSDARTPQGILCTAAIPPAEKMLTGHRLIALDGVQDPGNVGTILRTADAAGFSGILMSEKCADLFSPKTLRATMGSVFHIPFLRTEHLAEELLKLRTRKYSIVSTELGGDDFYKACPHQEDTVLVIGSEGNGVSAEVRNAATHHLALPMRGKAESLNAAVAAGIMIYEMTRE